MSDFLWMIPGAEDLETAVLFPGDKGLRLSSNARDSGFGVAGDYAAAAIALWMDSRQTRCILLNRALSIGWHRDVAGDGLASLVVAVSSGGSNRYEARYLVDLRSEEGGQTLRRVEVIYLRGSGFLCAVDGVALPAFSTTGTDNGISADTGPLGLGCSVVGSTIVDGPTGVEDFQPIGQPRAWGDAGGLTEPVDPLRGGIAYCRLERDPGVPVIQAAFDEELADAVDLQLSASPNDPTNGFSWLPSGSPAFGSAADVAAPRRITLGSRSLRSRAARQRSRR